MATLAVLIGYISIVTPFLLVWLIFIFPSTVIITVIAWLVSSVTYIALKMMCEGWESKKTTAELVAEYQKLLE